MSAYSFKLTLAAPGAAGFDNDFKKLGSLKHLKQQLNVDDDPSVSDITSVLDKLNREQQCQIIWVPEKAHSFAPLKGKPGNKKATLYLHLSIKDGADTIRLVEATLLSINVIDVLSSPKDSSPDEAAQAVKIGFASLTVKQ